MFHGCISMVIRLARIRHQRPEAGQLGKFEAESEGRESCLGSRHVCPRDASASQVAPRRASPTLSRRMRASSVFIFITCCPDGTIGAFPGAKARRQMRLDSISAAVRVVGLQGRAKTFSNVWLFD